MSFSGKMAEIYYNERKPGKRMYVLIGCTLPLGRYGRLKRL